MTQDEWDSCTDPEPMLEFLKGKVSDRKVRLFEVACCRRIWHLLPDDDCQRAVLVAERYADGQASDRERREVRKLIAPYKEPGNLAATNARGAAFDANEKTAGKRFIFGSAAAAAAYAARARKRRGKDPYKSTLRGEEKAQAGLLRDLLGPLLFRPVTLPPSVRRWNGGLIQRLAEAAYEHRLLPSGQLDPERLAVLADALEEAGADAALVAHLREPGPHHRGCWAVDLALGRE